MLDARDYIKKEMPKTSHNHRLIAAAFAAFGIVIAVLLHEISHALVAMTCGLKVTGIGLLPIGGYTTFDNGANPINPLSIIAISAAGPLMNLLIAVIALIPVKLLGESLTEIIFQYQAYLNIKLAVWNLIPFFIFDGGHMVIGALQYIFGQSIISTILVFIISAIGLGLWFVYRREFNKALEKLRKL